MEKTDVLDALVEQIAERVAAKEGGISLKHGASGTPISTGYFHGPGGLLTYPGTDPDVFHTIVGNKGIMGQLPTTPNLYMNPTYFTITGIQGDSGSEKTELCGDPPTGGLTKGCLTTAPFGRYERATQEVELNRLGQRIDRAEPMDLRMVGSPIHANGIFGTGPGNPQAPGDIMANEITKLLHERAVSIHRLLSGQLWTGSPVNNAASGAYREFLGFQGLINTGFVDAETGDACPSLDSDVKNFNYGRVDTDGSALVEALTAMMRFLRSLAERTGVSPVRWVFAMRESAFDQIARVWPCSYLTYRCNLTSGGEERVVVNAADQVRMRDDMLQGKYLLVDGTRFEVVIDDGIPENTPTNNANVTEGCFSSDVYVIPMSVMGGKAVTYMEYFQYTNPSILSALGNMILGQIEGPFLTWPRQTNQCVVWNAKIEPRLLLRTPWLAGRLQNVMYCPLQHERDSFPTDPYHVDGGKTSRPGPSLWELWQRGD
jgi:hypothetical protein